MNIAYLRCSTNKQDLEHQQSSITSYCSNNNIEIDRWVQDEGISAFTKSVTKRQGFTEVLHLAHLGHIDNLIVFESSRISRQFIEGQCLIDELTQCNVLIHSVMDNTIINQSELDSLWNSFRFFMNRKASKETSERVKSAKKLCKEQGKFLGGRQLLGFTVVDGKEVVDSKTAPKVRQMFDDYISYGSRYCMDTYNINSHQVLLQKLRNTKYIEIVGEAKFSEVQSTISSRTCNKKGNDTKSLNRSDILFEGLLYHKHCGSKLVIYRDRKGNPVFRCKHCKGKGGSYKKSFTGTKLLEYLEGEVVKILDSLDRHKLIDTYNSKHDKQRVILQYDIKELKEVIRQKQRVIDLGKEKLQSYILQNKADVMIEQVANMIRSTEEELTKISLELDDKESKLTRLLQNTQEQTHLVSKILEAKAIYLNGNIQQKKAIINLLVDKILVQDIENVDIYLNI